MVRFGPGALRSATATVSQNKLLIPCSETALCPPWWTKRRTGDVISGSFQESFQEEVTGIEFVVKYMHKAGLWKKQV